MKNPIVTALLRGYAVSCTNVTLQQEKHTPYIYGIKIDNNMGVNGLRKISASRVDVKHPVTVTYPHTTQWLCGYVCNILSFYLLQKIYISRYDAILMLTTWLRGCYILGVTQ